MAIARAKTPPPPPSLPLRAQELGVSLQLWTNTSEKPLVRGRVGESYPQAQERAMKHSKHTEGPVTAGGW